MTLPGTVPYLKALMVTWLEKSAAKAEEIEEAARDNYANWPTMSVQEREAAGRQAQRALGELAVIEQRLIRYVTGNLHRDEDYS